MANLKKTSLLILLFGTCFYGLSYHFLDKLIAQSLHTLSNPKLIYPFFQVITFLGDAKFSFGFTLISFILAMLVLFKNPQNRLANHLLFIALAMVLAIFLETGFKYLLGRYRPELLFQQGLYGFHFLTHRFAFNSSPSGHATRIFVLVAGFSLLWKRMLPVFVLIGLLVCLSRLVLELHYLSDVVFGAILGTLATLWTAKAYYSLTISPSNIYIKYN